MPTRAKKPPSIGSCTPERLYTFDVAALTEHNNKCRGNLACAA